MLDTHRQPTALLTHTHGVRQRRGEVAAAAANVQGASAAVQQPSAVSAKVVLPANLPLDAFNLTLGAGLPVALVALTPLMMKTCASAIYDWAVQRRGRDEALQRGV